MANLNINTVCDVDVVDDLHNRLEAVCSILSMVPLVQKHQGEVPTDTVSEACHAAWRDMGVMRQRSIGFGHHISSSKKQLKHLHSSSPTIARKGWPMGKHQLAATTLNWSPFPTTAPNSDEASPEQLIDALTTIGLRVASLAAVLGMAAGDSQLRLQDGDVREVAAMINELAVMGLDVAAKLPLTQLYEGGHGSKGEGN